ncbi:MAG: hypothetical protein JWQ38_1479 [Flavipsychrobacter sp.]|nr:hypothetical protein [Flavipsychrobacter sp.]
MDQTTTGATISFQQVFDILPGQYIVLDADHVIIAASDGYLNTISKNREEATGHNMADACATYFTITELHVIIESITQAFQNKVATSTQLQAPKFINVLNTPLLNGEDVIAVIHKIDNITQQVQLEDKVLHLNKELQAFSYSVSHDLRAPLRAVLGFSRMLEEDFKDTLGTEGKRLLGTVCANATRMGELIDGLLVFSRTGRKELKPRSVDMNAIAEAVLKEITKETNSNAKVTIEYLPMATSEPLLISQVFTCLISNAIKFSSKKEHPAVHITSSIIADEIVYSVADNGVGFNMRYADKLFGTFQRLHTSDEFEGTGIGLAIVQRIINMHGGSTWIESEPDKGTTTYFSLPLSK